MPKGRAKGLKMPERPIVQINDKYRVVIDKYNLILQQYNPELKTDNEEDKGNTDGWKFCGYYTTWDGIFWRLTIMEAEREIGKKKFTDIIELKKIFVSVKEEVKKMASEIKIKYSE
jgi:hypothetical protein